MKRIAYLASRVTLPGSFIRRTDAFEHDLMMGVLRPAFRERAMDIVDISWDDADADWTSFAAVIIGTTWDYWDRHEEFLQTLERIERHTRLFNPSRLVRWNSRKTYLRDLAAKGITTIPTLWLDACTEARVQAAFDLLDQEDLVFKRQVGAGAKGQYRLSRGEPIPDMPHPMMAQPFLKSIEQEGELSFVFIAGHFCHALVKRPQPGDYRIQSLYGGRETALDPAPADLQAAQKVMEAIDTPPLYARVDMVRGDHGALFLMELEIIEPYLYPEQGLELGPRMASAVEQILAAG
jgi:hypothetical protein